MCKAAILDNRIILDPVFVRIASSDTIRGPFSFLLDTGATNSALNYTSAVDEIGLSLAETQQLPMICASGESRCHRLNEAVEIIFRKTVPGGWEIHSEIMPSIDIFPEMDMEPPNLLGMDILSRFNHETDMLEKTVSLKRLEKL